MKISLQLIGSSMVCALLLALPASGLADCKTVKGRVMSSVVFEYSDGTPCPSPLCTEGRFTGRLKGHIRYFATAAAPFNALLQPTPAVPNNVDASTGIITLTPKRFCKGALIFADTSAFSYDSNPVVSGKFEGIVSAIETVVAGTGGCAGATGRLRLQGVFDNGCVDCRYVGEICLADDGDAHEDDEDDDDEGDDYEDDD